MASLQPHYTLNRPETDHAILRAGWRDDGQATSLSTQLRWRIRRVSTLGYIEQAACTLVTITLLFFLPLGGMLLFIITANRFFDMLWAVPSGESFERATLPDLANCEVDVDIALYRCGQFIGWDSGRVSFVDGWLVFQGPRTDFCLSRLGCHGVDRNDWVPWGHPGREFEYAIATNEAEPVEVWFRPTQERHLLGHYLELWWTADPVDGRPLLPPNLPSTELTLDRLIVRRRPFFNALFLVAFVAWFGKIAGTPGLILVLAIGLGIWSAAAKLRLRERKWLRKTDEWVANEQNAH